MSQRLLKREKDYWEQILERLIALTRVLGTQNLAFRGNKERLFEPGNGNFLKFCEYLALFDPVMKEPLRKVEEKEMCVASPAIPFCPQRGRFSLSMKFSEGDSPQE